MTARAGKLERGRLPGHDRKPGRGMGRAPSPPRQPRLPRSPGMARPALSPVVGPAPFRAAPSPPARPCPPGLPRATAPCSACAGHSPEPRARAHLSRRALNSAAVVALAATLPGRSPQVLAAMAGGKPYDVYVKGDPATNTLGDCPFCHRVLLTLEEKHVPYEKHYISLDHKPKWLFEVSEKGSVPVLKIDDDKWLTDSAEIVDYLDSKYPEPPFGKTESIPEAASKVFPAFVQFLRAPEGSKDAPEKEAALVSALKELDGVLAESGPLLGGSQPQAGDVMLAPRLYHAQTALKAIKGWSFPDLPHIKAYRDAWAERESWKNTHYGEDLVVEGWNKHLS